MTVLRTSTREKCQSAILNLVKLQMREALEKKLLFKFVKSHFVLIIFWKFLYPFLEIHIFLYISHSFKLFIRFNQDFICEGSTKAPRFVNRTEELYLAPAGFLKRKSFPPFQILTFSNVKIVISQLKGHNCKFYLHKLRNFEFLGKFCWEFGFGIVASFVCLWRKFDLVRKSLNLK